MKVISASSTKKPIRRKDYSIYAILARKKVSKGGKSYVLDRIYRIDEWKRCSVQCVAGILAAIRGRDALDTKGARCTPYGYRASSISRTGKGRTTRIEDHESRIPIRKKPRPCLQLGLFTNNDKAATTLYFGCSCITTFYVCTANRQS